MEIKKRMLQVLLLIVILVSVTVLVNVIIISTNGENVPAPEIERSEVIVGNGEELDYLILGDSTTIAQGGDYSEGYVVKTAQKLAEEYTVTYANYGVSGARVNDVLQEQLPNVSNDFIPDLVLIGVGANDVTHLTSLGSIQNDLNEIINILRDKNQDVTIILTGSASMGDVERFPQPTRWLAGVRTGQVNKVFKQVSEKQGVVFAAIAEKTGNQFRQNPDYFAPDKFHPNNSGYQEWTDVLNKVIATTLSR